MTNCFIRPVQMFSTQQTNCSRPWSSEHGEWCCLSGNLFPQSSLVSFLNRFCLRPMTTQPLFLLAKVRKNNTWKNVHEKIPMLASVFYRSQTKAKCLLVIF